MEVKWCFYDPETKTKTAELATDEAQMTILKMRPRDINRFYFSRSDANAWKPLKHLMASNASPFTGLTMLADLSGRGDTHIVNTQLKMKPVDKETQDEIEQTFTNSCIDVNKTVASDYIPAAPKIEFVFMNAHGAIFRTYAKHPTQDGSFCEKNIPAEFYNTTFDVVVINTVAINKYFGKLKLRGKMTLKNNSSFVEFIFTDKTQRSHLIESLSFSENNSYRKKAV